jgi:hypothetical protein
MVCLGILLLFACKKEDKNTKYPIQYKLAGKYYRDSAITSDGYKMLNLKPDGKYCWTRVIDGQDSNFCFGTYVQTSDTSLIWENNTEVFFRITPIDTIQNGIKLQLFSSPPMAALYGFHQ